MNDPGDIGTGVELVLSLTTAAHAVERATAGGPVHLNAPFRDPLPPIADETAKGLEEEDWAAFFAHLDAAAPVVTQAVAWSTRATRGVIVAGPGADAAGVHALAKATGWPVLADVLSPVRRVDGSGRCGNLAGDARRREPRCVAWTQSGYPSGC